MEILIGCEGNFHTDPLLYHPSSDPKNIGRSAGSVFSEPMANNNCSIDDFLHPMCTPQSWMRRWQTYLNKLLFSSYPLWFLLILSLCTFLTVFFVSFLRYNFFCKKGSITIRERLIQISGFSHGDFIIHLYRITFCHW